jgi:2,4-dienoyl-CoA reductase-like NADH-dependent reductase (Old Yellow Enzyme family)
MNDGSLRMPFDLGSTEPHAQFPHLFSPLKVGPITLKNRFINSAHQTGFAHDGDYTSRLLAYHRERARGGAAMILSQATAVVPGYLDLWNFDDRIIEQYREVVATVGEHGAHYFAELWHPGRLSHYSGAGADFFEAPSAVPLLVDGVDWRVPHALEFERIRAIIRAFGEATIRCREGGVSGIELHFAHGNLVEQFMSPVTNHRDDEWGGSLENRLRFAKEVATTVREAAGQNLAVGARITGSGLDADEPSHFDMLEIAGTIDSWKLLDYLSVTMGHYADEINTARNIPNMTFEPGLWARFGKGVKNVVDIPVFLVGRVNHPRVAEELIAGGNCDAVVMARALIADPYLPVKAQTGRVTEIRPCVGAMNCLHHLYRNGGIRCIHNPTVGREEQLGGELPLANERRRVLVVGGGPSGLESARVAALRGHEVVLLERDAALGGQVRAASRPPGRGELAQVVEWLAAQCESAGVVIMLSVEASPEVVASYSPDVVVVATGSVLEPASEPGEIPVYSVLDAVDSARCPATRVVVADDLGDWQGFGVALTLATRGVNVAFVTPNIFPGSALELTNWRISYERLVSLGVTFYPVARIARSEGTNVVLHHGYGRVEQVLENVDGIVSVTFPKANDSVYHALVGRFPEVVLVGDASAPRGIEESIFDGHMAGRRI